jgi:transposase-like protein
VAEYTETLKARMVRRMLGPRATRQTDLARETGIPQPTLSRWLRETATFKAMKEHDKPDEAPPAPAARRPQDWSAEEKLAAVVETRGMPAQNLGEFLRRHGLHAEELEAWRTSAMAAMAAPPRKGGGESKRIRELEKEIRKKDKALAETAALLVLSKKVRALWGDAADDTDEKDEP